MNFRLKPILALILMSVICITSCFGIAEAKKQYRPLSPLGMKEYISILSNDVKRAGVILSKPYYNHLGGDPCSIVGFNNGKGVLTVYTNNGLVSNAVIEFDLINSAPAGERSSMTNGMIVFGTMLMELGAEEPDINKGFSIPFERDTKAGKKGDFKKTYTVYSRKMKYNLEINVEVNENNEIKFDIWAF